MEPTLSTPPRRGRPPLSPDAVAAIRQRIVTAARDLFAAEGYDGVSMRKVAARAGCLPSALYAHFPNKRRLLHFLWEAIFAELIETLEHSQTACLPADRFRNLCLTHIDFWLQRPQDYRAIFLVEDRIQDSGDRYFVENPVARQYLGVMDHAIIAAQQRGDVRAGAPEEIRNVLLCGLQGTAYSLIGIPEFDWGDPDRLAAMTVETLLRGLR